MPQVSKDDPRLADSARAVAGAAKFSVSATGWPWTVLVIGMIVLGGTNIAYPLMRTLSGLCGAAALAVAVTSRSSKWVRPGPSDWIIAGIVALFVIQLIPLPPVLWTQLNGREAIEAIDRAVFGEPLWRPLSINTEATWQTFAFLVPFLGAYLAFRSGNAVRRSAMLRGVAVGFAIAALLGLLQVAGLDFLHPFPIEADNQFGNGFFNHNHHATFLLMAAVMVISHGSLPRRGLIDARLIAITVAAALAVTASGSRAGFVLMLAAALAFATIWFVSRPRPPTAEARPLRPIVWALGAAGLAAAIVSTLVINTNRFALGRGSLMEDQRLELAPIAWRAIGQFWPLGSGFGTFQTPYRQVEPIEALRVLDVTHAHNDLLEAVVEGGVLALALIIAMTLRIAVLTIRALKANGRANGSAMGSAKGPETLRTALTGLALAIPLVHSLVDYPLRTMAIAVLFAVALASLEARASETRITSA